MGKTHPVKPNFPLFLQDFIPALAIAPNLPSLCRVARGRCRCSCTFARMNGNEKKVRGPACKPGSVPRGKRGDDHLSSLPVARQIERPTRGSVAGRTSPAPLFGLAPGGVCRASLSPGCWWALTLRDRGPPTFSPLPGQGSVPGLTPTPDPWPGGMLSVALSLSLTTAGVALDGGSYPPPCPVEPGLSSVPGLAPAWDSDRPAASRTFLIPSYGHVRDQKGLHRLPDATALPRVHVGFFQVHRQRSEAAHRERQRRQRPAERQRLAPDVDLVALSAVRRPICRRVERCRRRKREPSTRPRNASSSSCRFEYRPRSARSRAEDTPHISQ
jgi:hypothetical protein